MKAELKEKLLRAARGDRDLVCDRENLDKVLGHNPDYLKDVFDITKSDLIRLERLGLAMKARYVVEHKRKRYVSVGAAITNIPVTGTHRVRWIIFKEALCQ